MDSENMYLNSGLLRVVLVASLEHGVVDVESKVVVGGLGKNGEFDVSTIQASWSLRTRHSRLGLKECSRPCPAGLSPRTPKKGAKVTIHFLDHALLQEDQRCVRPRCSYILQGCRFSRS